MVIITIVVWFMQHSRMSKIRKQKYLYTQSADRYLGALAKLREATVTIVLSVRRHVTARLLLDGFS
jgi:hypothetical protein